MSHATKNGEPHGPKPPGRTRYGLFIDNESVEPESTEWLHVEDPASGRVWAEVPDAGPADVERAVQSARLAFAEGEWPRLGAAGRARMLIRLSDVISDHAEELSRLQVAENGKLFREMFGQARQLTDYFAYYAGLAQMPRGYTNHVPMGDMLNYTVREPLGVVGAITPWNSPLLLLLWKLGPALAAGNTVVAKPSEHTPVATLRLAEIAAEAGLPPGVFNVVTGLGDAAGAALVRHPDVDKIAFTGSTATGKVIAAQAGESLKRVSLELGGKSPNIVFADADLDSVIPGLVSGIFSGGGQTCMAGSRILVQDALYDRVVDELAERAESIRVGHPLDDHTEMGPISCRVQYDKVRDYVAVAGRDGARLVAGGKTAEVSDHPGGLYFRPTVFADVTNNMRIAREEVFGPVASVLRFGTEDEAVRIANDTPFGLAAAVWTGSIQLAHRMADKLRAGTVWINNYRKTSYSSPFGGFKHSGLGRENGPEALVEYTEVKSVWVDTGHGIRDPFNPRA